MSTVHAQISIDASLHRVWDTVMDPHRLGEWVTIHSGVTLHSRDPTAAGARMDQMLRVVGVTFTVHWTLAAVEAPREAEWRGRGPALSRALIRYLLSGDTHGPTTFDYTNEFHAPGGALGNVASRFVIGHISEREAHDSLQRLKALIERE